MGEFIGAENTAEMTQLLFHFWLKLYFGAGWWWWWIGQETNRPNKKSPACVGNKERKQPLKVGSLNGRDGMLHWPLFRKEAAWPQQGYLSPTLESRFK